MAIQSVSLIFETLYLQAKHVLFSVRRGDVCMSTRPTACGSAGVWLQIGPRVERPLIVISINRFSASSKAKQDSNNLSKRSRQQTPHKIEVNQTLVQIMSVWQSCMSTASKPAALGPARQPFDWAQPPNTSDVRPCRTSRCSRLGPDLWWLAGVSCELVHRKRAQGIHLRGKTKHRFQTIALGDTKETSMTFSVPGIPW